MSHVIKPPKSIFRRRNFFVDKKLQLTFALASFVLISVSMIAVWLMMDWLFKISFAQHWQQFSEGALLMWQVNKAVWIFITVDAVTVFFLFIFFLHYVAGPLHRLEKTMVHMLESDYTEPVK